MMASVAALASTYKTLDSGLLYEKVPEIPVQRELYLALTKFLHEIKQKAAHHEGSDYTLWVGALMLAIALVFVWRSFYAMRIPEKAKA